MGRMQFSQMHGRKGIDGVARAGIGDAAGSCLSEVGLVESFTALTPLPSHSQDTPP